MRTDPKKFQVFISSTFEDMKQERQAAVSAVLEAGHIPAGMELFSSGNETQLETIRRWIDNSDVYLLILGGRYGSIEPKSQKSYIELEFDHAVAQGKSLFSIVIKESALEDKAKTMGLSAIERKNGAAYEAFRSRVLSMTSGFYIDTKDIKLEILKSLTEKTGDPSLLGWVRGCVELESELRSIETEEIDLLNGFKKVEPKESFNIDYPAMPSLSQRIEIQIDLIAEGYGYSSLAVTGSWADFFPLFAASFQAHFSDWNNEYSFVVNDHESRLGLAGSILRSLKAEVLPTAKIARADFERLTAYYVEAGLMSDGVGREPFTETGQRLARRVRINVLDFGKSLVVTKGELPAPIEDEIPF